MRLSVPAALTALLAAASALNLPRQEQSSSPKPSDNSQPDVTSTITVTDRSDSTVTSETTVFRTVFSTIVVTVTDISTEVVTKSDVETATSTVYVTSTLAAKRHINLAAAPAEATPALHVPVKTGDAAEAQVTPPAGGFRGGDGLELLRRAGLIHLVKRETIYVTVTVAADGVTTVFNTVTSTVLSTTTSESHSTSVITSTSYANAKTTVTITSTIIIKATTVTTGPAQTVGTVPDGSNIGNGDNNGGSSGGSGSGSGDTNTSDSGGLSTGAKAGIGVGVGVGGLLIIGGIATYLYKQHKLKPHVVDDGLGAGMSEIPVGPSPGLGGAGAAAALASRDTRTPDHPRKSPVGSGGGYVSPPSVTPEPAYGAAELGVEGRRPYGAELSGEDALPRFPTAAEADGRPVMGYTSGPVSNVYEMPAEQYR